MWGRATSTRSDLSPNSCASTESPVFNGDNDFIIICTKPYLNIFPRAWNTPLTQISISPAEPEFEIDIRQCLLEVMRRYPPDACLEHVNRIYVVGDLIINGDRFGATRSLRKIYISTYGAFDTTIRCEALATAFHAEFSSILFNNHRNHLYMTDWTHGNPEGFKYLGSGVAALRLGRHSVEPTTAAMSEGFINEYAQSSLENDFNAICIILFGADRRTWNHAKSYPKVKKKMDLAIKFLRSTGMDINWDYFESLDRDSLQ